MARLDVYGVLLVFALLASAESISCFSKTDCKSCTNHVGYYFFSCSWCPLSNTCHTYGSLYNYCDGHVSIVEPEKCIPEISKPYNHTLASQLASWASIAYTLPGDIDPQVLNHVLHNELPGQYRMLKFLRKRCDEMIHYSACSLLVAISDQEKNIIISFEGTQNIDQLVEQLLSAAITGQQEASIGGQVLYYNYNVHQLLYPCLKDYLKELLNNNSHYTVTVTGHSLGGAQAQLAAATLVKDHVIPGNRISVYTFGAPRFGDADFAVLFDETIKTNWRLVQASDPVPRIPPYFLYHTHGEVWFNKSGVTLQSNYTICAVNEDKKCAASQGSLCFTKECIDIHKDYFIKSMGDAFDKKILGGINKPTYSQYGSCDSVDFSSW